MRLLITLICCILASTVMSQQVPVNPNKSNNGLRQGKWTIRFDKDWKEVTPSQQATFFRVVDYRDGKPEGLVHDYYINGKMQFEGRLLSENPDVNDGYCVFYLEDGSKDKELTYKNGLLDGKAVYYYLNKKYSEGTYNNSLENLDWIFYGNDYFSYYKTANQFMKLENYPNAEKNYLKAIEAGKKEYGENSAQVMDGYWAISYTYQNLNNAKAVAWSWRETFRIANKLDIKDDILIKDLIKFSDETGLFLIKSKNPTYAIAPYKQAVADRERIQDLKSEGYYYDLYNVKNLLFNAKRYDSVDYYFDKIAAMLPIKSPAYQMNLKDWTSFAIYHPSNVIIERIEKRCEESIREREQRDAKDSLYVQVLTTYGRLLSERGQFERALRSYTDARTVLDPIKETKKRSYIGVSSYTASLYNKNKKYDAQAIQFFKEYERLGELWKNQIGDQYQEVLGDLILFYYNRGELTKTEALLRNAMVIEEKTNGQRSSEYQTMKVLLAGVLEKEGKNSESQAMVKTISKEDEMKFIENTGLAQASKDVGDLGKYLQTGNFVMAITLFEKSSDMINGFFRKQGDFTALTEMLCGISTCYRETGNLTKAFATLMQAREVVDKNFPKDAEINISLLMHEGEFYEATGDLLKAEDRYIEGLKIVESFPAKKRNANDELFYDLEVRLAGVMVLMRSFEKAETYYDDVAVYIKKRFGTGSIQYANVLIALTQVYQHFKEYWRAQENFDMALPILKKSGEENPNYIGASSTQADLFLLQQKYAEAEAIYLRIREHYRRSLGTKSDKYLAITSQLGTLYCYNNQLNKAGPLLRELNEFHLYRINNFFPTLSEEEKALFYKKVYAQINAYNGFARRYYQQQPVEAGTMYDLQLQTKGLLFRATNRVKETILTAKDDSLKAMYQRWQADKDYLASVYQMSDVQKKAQGIDEKRLEERANALEKKLTQRSEYFSALVRTIPAWNTLQQKLIPGEAAVEIIKIIEMYPAYKFKYIGKGLVFDSLGQGGTARVVEIYSDKTPGSKAGIKEGESIVKMNGVATKGKTISQISDLMAANPVTLEIQKKNSTATYNVKLNSDSVFEIAFQRKIKYAALILTSETKEHPEMVNFENGDALENRYGRYYQNAIKQRLKDEFSYAQFWQPLQSKLAGIKKVYFSPDGVYNFINPSSLYNTTTKKYLLDEMEVVIVGNTAGLLDPVRMSKSKKTVLIGFPDYNSTNTATSKGVNYAADVDYSLLKSDSTMSRFMNGSSVSELPGTKTEVISIESLLKGAQMEVSLMISKNASEEKVKALQAPRLLHIATHGFFLNDISQGNAGQRGITGVSAQKLSENPLLRSGLLLAGAGKTISGGKENSGEDGILTAYEAMNLNLTDTELIVLSACETGLGEIKSGEGVYGLQRAFRAAGAQTVLMSLWKVDDEATQQLMTEFYKEWLAKGDKRQALRTAQIILRQKYDHPYYWGAFEMVGR